MPDLPISSLPPLGAPADPADLLAIVDVDGGPTTKKVTVAELTTTSTETLQTAYDNGQGTTNGTITVDATTGPVDVINDSTPFGPDIFRVRSFATGITQLGVDEIGFKTGNFYGAIPANVLYVGSSGCQFLTITQAITAAISLTPGPTRRVVIVLYPPIDAYFESFTIPDYVTVIGLDRRVRIEGTVTFGGNNADLKNVTIFSDSAGGDVLGVDLTSVTDTSKVVGGFSVDLSDTAGNNLTGISFGVSGACTIDGVNVRVTSNNAGSVCKAIVGTNLAFTPGSSVVNSYLNVIKTGGGANPTHIEKVDVVSNCSFAGPYQLRRFVNCGTVYGPDINDNTLYNPGGSYTIGSTTVNLIDGGSTISLPSSPRNGETRIILNGDGNAASSAATVNRSGNNINGAASNLTIDKDYGGGVFIYDQANTNWLFFGESSPISTSGTWTPTLSDGTNAATTSSTGTWIKVGDAITIALTLTWSSLASMTGNIRISLPFTIGSNTVRFCPGIGNTNGWDIGTGQLVIHSDAGLSYVVARRVVNNSTSVVLSASDLQSTGSIQISGTYSIT